MITGRPGAAATILSYATEKCAQGSCKKLAIACTLVNNAGGCTNGVIEQIKLAKNLTAQQCHDECEKEMPLKGMTKGCWVIAGDQSCTVVAASSVSVANSQGARASNLEREPSLQIGLDGVRSRSPYVSHRS